MAYGESDPILVGHWTSAGDALRLICTRRYYDEKVRRRARQYAIEKRERDSLGGERWVVVGEFSDADNSNSAMVVQLLERNIKEHAMKVAELTTKEAASA